MGSASGITSSRKLVSIAAGVALALASVAITPQAALAQVQDSSYIPPSVSGDCIVGSTLTVDLGTLPPNAVLVTFEWASIRAQPGRGIEPTYYGTSDLSFVIPASTGPIGAESYKVYPSVTYWYEDEEGQPPYPDLPVQADPCTVAPAPGAVNTSPPVVDGDVQVGSTLTASPGEWSETDGWEYSYLWSGGPAGTTKGASLTLNAGYLGRSLTLTVSAKKRGYVTGEASVTLPPVALGPAPAPVDGPAISGSRHVGSPLSVSVGTWTPSDLSYSCAWYRGTTKLSSSCSPYTPVPGDLNSDVVVKVTGSRQGYSAGSPSASAPVRIIAGPSATVTRAPAINGTAVVGEIITLDQGQWILPPGARFNYQWLRDGIAVSQKTSGAYILGSADAGKRMSVRVTVTAPGYAAATVTTSQTAPAGKGPRPVAESQPQITGTAAVGSTLTATPGTWSRPGLSYKYTWLRNGTSIANASGPSYKLTTAELGTTIAVRVTVTSDAWTTTTATSSGTSKVAKGAAPTVVTTPKITGTAKVGSTLSVSTGTWSKPSLTFRYQWFSNGKPIPNATASAYTLKSSQKGKTITVKVVASRAGYYDGAAITKATSSVQ